jgi:glycosyltransferase involved in cell wall biosynthesis
VRPRRVEVRDHGRYFKSSVVESRSMARHKLGLDESQTLLLCIGFIQPQKGFDRAIRAFRRIPGEAKMAVVGSLTYETDELRAYMNELEALAAADERVDVRERMVSDDEFDRWILASDAVILPYRLIWSSGVMERAHLLERNVVVSSAGGLPEQLRPGDTKVTNDEELAEAMAKVVGEGTPLQLMPLTAREAAELLEVDSRRRGGGGSEVDRALRALSESQGVLPLLNPSERRMVGPFLDLVKRALRRSMGWLLTPLIGQINEFQRRTTEALDAIVAEQRESEDEEES